MYKKLFLSISSVFFGLNVLDLIETKMALNKGMGIIELNPIANFLFSVGIAEIFKILAMMVVLSSLYLLYKINPKIACGISFSLMVYMAFIVVWNLVQLSM